MFWARAAEFHTFVNKFNRKLPTCGPPVGARILGFGWFSGMSSRISCVFNTSFRRKLPMCASVFINTLKRTSPVRGPLAGARILGFGWFSGRGFRIGSFLIKTLELNCVFEAFRPELVSWASGCFLDHKAWTGSALNSKFKKKVIDLRLSGFWASAAPLGYNFFFLFRPNQLYAFANVVAAASAPPRPTRLTKQVLQCLGN